MGGAGPYDSAVPPPRVRHADRPGSRARAEDGPHGGPYGDSPGSTALGGGWTCRPLPRLTPPEVSGRDGRPKSRARHPTTDTPAQGMDSMGTPPRQAEAARTRPEDARPAGPDRWWWLFLPVAALALIAYAPALDGGFIDIDDEEGFVKNQAFRGLDRDHLAWAGTTRLLGVYQPVMWWIAEVDYALFGLDPRGYHATALALHAASASALFFLIRALLGRATGTDDPAARRRRAIASALAASAFAAHPFRASVVSWIANIGYLPCALFVMLSVFAYLRATGARGRVAYLAWLAASVALYALSLGAHAVPMALPAVLLILDVYPLRRLGSGGLGRWVRLALEKVPFAALGMAFAAMAVWARGGGEGVASLDKVGIVERLAHASYSVWFYVVKTLAPTALRAIYPLPLTVRWTEPRFALAILGVIGFAAAAVVLRKRRPWIAAAGGCYVLLLLPNAGLVRNITVIAADHYSYIATIPLLPGRRRGPSSWSRDGPSVGRGRCCSMPRAGRVLVALIDLGTRLKLEESWHDSVAVWTRNVEASPTPDPYFQSRLGRALLDAGRLDEARAALVRGLEIDPNFPITRNKLGLVLVAQGRQAEGAAQFAEAVPGRAELRRRPDQQRICPRPVRPDRRRGRGVRRRRRAATRPDRSPRQPRRRPGPAGPVRRGRRRLRTRARPRSRSSRGEEEPRIRPDQSRPPARRRRPVRRGPPPPPRRRRRPPQPRPLPGPARPLRRGRDAVRRGPPPRPQHGRVAPRPRRDPPGPRRRRPAAEIGFGSRASRAPSLVPRSGTKADAAQNAAGARIGRGPGSGVAFDIHGYGSQGVNPPPPDPAGARSGPLGAPCARLTIPISSWGRPFWSPLPLWERVRVRGPKAGAIHQDPLTLTHRGPTDRRFGVGPSGPLSPCGRGLG